LASKGNSTGQQQLWKKSEECLFHNFNPNQNRYDLGLQDRVEVSVTVGLPTVLDMKAMVLKQTACTSGNFNIVVSLVEQQ